MSVVLALPRLYDAVVAQLAADAAEQALAPVPNFFGWREPAKQSESLRIVWVPGKPDGDAGAMGPAKQPGRNPRPLATLEEFVTVFLEAADVTAPENELAQYKAARLLFDAWYRAVYLAARGTFLIDSIAWLADRKERRYGATLRVVIAIEAMIPDEPSALAPVDVSAEVTTEVLDRTELDIVDPERMQFMSADAELELGVEAEATTV